ncbi:MAG: hypothetical protein JWO77_2564, partial [Ilumatobacteraceae bacterium]|nr:hypothetical protein [Ilumatobacteraceae bacterium]
PTPSIPPGAHASRRRTLGLPPSLGLAAALMSFPAVAFVLYGGLALLASLVFSSSSSSSNEYMDFSGMSSGFAFVGAVLILLGLVGLYGVVMVMAGSATGRTICTVFLCISVVLSVLSFATSPNAGIPLTLAMPAYCMWALWGRPGRSVF